MKGFIKHTILLFVFVAPIFTKGQAPDSSLVHTLEQYIDIHNLYPAGDIIQKIEEVYPIYSEQNIHFLSLKCTYLAALGENEKALTLALSMKRLLLPNHKNYRNNRIIVHNRINDGYYFNKQYDKCQTVLDSLILWIQDKDMYQPRTNMVYQIQKGILYEKTDRLKSAIEMYEKAEALIPEVKDSILNEILYGNFGVTYRKLDNEKRAWFYLEKAGKYVNRQDSSASFTLYNVLWKHCINFKKMQEASLYRDTVSVYYNSTNFDNRRVWFENNISHYNTLNNKELSFKYIQQYQQSLSKRYEKKFSQEIEELSASLKRENQLRIDTISIEKQQKLLRIRTNYAILMCIIFGLGITAALAMNNIQKRQRKMTYIELEQQLLQNQLNPHFIFNTLANIKGLINQNKNNIACNYLDRFHTLLLTTLIDNKERSISLDKEINAIESYLELQKIRFNDRFEYTLSNDIKVPKTIHIPPMLIQPFIENCFKHAFTEKHIEGKIDIHFIQKKEDIYCKILDNGIGLKMNSIVSKQSLSTRINKERLELLDSRYKTKGEVIIRNRTDGIAGVEVTIKLPYNIILS